MSINDYSIFQSMRRSSDLAFINRGLHLPRRYGYTGVPVDNPLALTPYPPFYVYKKPGAAKILCTNGIVELVEQNVQTSVAGFGDHSYSAGDKVYLSLTIGAGWSVTVGSSYPVASIYIPLAELTGSGENLVVTKWYGNVSLDGVFPVALSASTGAAGSITTDCAFTYTVKTAGIDIFGATTAPLNVRTAKCEYLPATKGVAFFDSSWNVSYFALDEVVKGKQVTHLTDWQIDGMDFQVKSQQITVLDSGDEGDWTTVASGEDCP